MNLSKLGKLTAKQRGTLTPIQCWLWVEGKTLQGRQAHLCRKDIGVLMLWRLKTPKHSLLLLTGMD